MQTFFNIVFYALVMIFVFGIMIFIHEAGHFFTARRCGITIKEFAIGMGPKLVSWKSKKYGTQHSIRLLPIGGYVSMEGEDEDSTDENAFCNKPVWKRMLVVAAGPFMNIVLGILLTLIVVLSQGRLASTTINEFSEDAVSSQKLMQGDEIIKIDGTRVYTGNEVLYEIMNQGYKPIDVVVKRNGEKITLNDVSFKTFVEDGVTFAEMDFSVYPESRAFGNILKQTASRTVSTVKMVYDSLIGLLTGRFGINAVSGPVGVAQTVGEAAKTDLVSFIYIGAILTINLGVFNFIPFPALDGGRFLLLCIEGIRRKPINRKIEAWIHTIGLFILLGFVIFFDVYHFAVAARLLIS
jgi:regulator of sigma E protease